jgi:uncharacterized protein
LFWKSNPAFVEWIQSSITYMEPSVFRADAIKMLPNIYAPDKGIYHYLSMAKTNYRGYLREDVVPLKKYFYVLRPLLAARWVAKTGGAAPIEFEKLLTLLEHEPEVLAQVRSLLDLKRKTPELGLADAVPALNEFIEAELAIEPDNVPKKSHSPHIVNQLNQLFHTVLDEYKTQISPSTYIR